MKQPSKEKDKPMPTNTLLNETTEFLLRQLDSHIAVNHDVIYLRLSAHEDPAIFILPDIQEEFGEKEQESIAEVLRIKKKIEKARLPKG
ncbi:MAG: hypothetical protein GY822_17565 [Deltaproteobacteria bacterium]|nr:hypothetical protein [Deltaproteobacteria bacterium]